MHGEFKSVRVMESKITVIFEKMLIKSRLYLPGRAHVTFLYKNKISQVKVEAKKIHLFNV